MDPVRAYDYLVRSRQRLLEWVRRLDAAGYAGDLPGWPRSPARTLTHVLLAEWYYVQRLERRELPPYESWPIREEHPLPLPELERAWAEQSAATRRALAAIGDEGEEIRYRVTQDDGRAADITATAGDIATQLILHEMHHRAQVMGMLRQHGVAIEDIDYNTMMYRREVREEA